MLILKAKRNKEIVEAFLINQIGAGEDRNKANELDVYQITLDWYPHLDRIESTSNTGNRGLREGILMRFLGTLN